eukprot:CAMPEP_0198284032 /NCGR_PEP_ID=MMETSP1449-20131203/3573_1 /TAXON_ID=420275 /ORGANISM="Attheya septentrionalis, Strain CCMP2084" /LENGTH=458 /DNA_ID=CAMNT_0043980937 /DNA_START=98 /DNA_END=1474 /DNA_ORIENTATION=+
MRPLYVRRSKEGLCRTVRRFATGEKEVPVNQQGTANERHQRIWYASAAAAAATSALGTYSLYLREVRQAQIEKLPLASESGVFFMNGTSNLANQNGIGKYGPNRDLTVLQSTVARAGLMGTSVKGAKSVKEELDTIRRWHHERGFRGGLVLRALTQPLFSSSGDDDGHQEDLDPSEITGGPNELGRMTKDFFDQRECYYLYYEILGNGRIQQHIFCRGTTLFADIFTCLNSWLVYDDELDCQFHQGFLGHANRLIADVEPLLVPPSDNGGERGTVEISGHSLGGAVAYIVAMKLKKRGYNVVRVTSVGSPRYCDLESTEKLFKLLPRDCLRIEEELDIFTYLSPYRYGPQLGNKLWFVRDSSSGEKRARYIPYSLQVHENMKWIDSVIVNFLIPELALNWGRSHRVPVYLSDINQLRNHVEEKMTSHKNHITTNEDHPAPVPEADYVAKENVILVDDE